MLGTIGAILAILLALAVGYFSVMNQTPVSVSWWPGMPPRAAFIWEIALYAAMAGCLVSGLFLVGPWLGAHRRCRQLRRRVRELEQKLVAGGPSISEAPRPTLNNGVVTSTAGPGRAVAARTDEEPV
jgi:uncharacterized integral membrane protein